MCMCVCGGGRGGGRGEYRWEDIFEINLKRLKCIFME